VLVLEEPQATFGEDLDAVLNHVAWNLFPTATVLTIAHQIKYVVHCDKIMVVDGGKVCMREFILLLTEFNLYQKEKRCPVQGHLIM
jgi:ABC-type multidrug transport system fused ATPase/permease subunit